MGQQIKQKYIKSFSKGQITVPKEFREKLGLGDDFWLKMYVENASIVAEPMVEIPVKDSYAERLADVKGDWFSEQEWKKNRKDLKKREEEYGY